VRDRVLFRVFGKADAETLEALSDGFSLSWWLSVRAAAYCLRRYGAHIAIAGARRKVISWRFGALTSSDAIRRHLPP
jgi:hypothetical protein